MAFLIGLAVLVLLALIWLAIDAHAVGQKVLIGRGLVIAAGVAAVVGLWLGWQSQVAIAAAVGAAGFLLWYLTRIPRHDRVWIPEVAHGATADIGPTVRLHKVRRFRWTAKNKYDERWDEWHLDPDAITSVDLVMSIWSSPLIAHTMVSFGFADGRHLVFSGETRRQKGDRFTITGGFFRRFELVMLAADERDVIHLRTDIRREKVSLYPVLMDAGARKALFLAFLEQGNDLVTRPKWYNTVTTNCTTVPFEIVRTIAPRLRRDWRLLLSGQLPGFLYKLGVLPKGSKADLDARAVLPISGDDGQDDAAYSRSLRAQWRDPT
jgi:Domain of unknown function (DUF4105)